MGPPSSFSDLFFKFILRGAATGGTHVVRKVAVTDHSRWSTERRRHTRVGLLEGREEDEAGGWVQCMTYALVVEKDLGWLVLQLRSGLLIAFDFTYEPRTRRD